jgi:hypothetical protein
VESIPFGGQKSEFRPKGVSEELVGMYDRNGDLRFHRIFEWMLSKIGNADDVSFYEYMAARMWNYMLHVISMTHWKPKYFCTGKEKYIKRKTSFGFLDANSLGVCKAIRQLSGHGRQGKPWM